MIMILLLEETWDLLGTFIDFHVCDRLPSIHCYKPFIVPPSTALISLDRCKGILPDINN